MTPERIENLLKPYLVPMLGVRELPLRTEVFAALSAYLELLLRWNARTNLTGIREPDEIVRRHFGESLLLGRLCPEDTRTVLDLGSGAGFPGLPMQLAWPALAVTLAESQGKKAAFLREVVRELHLSTEIWSGRAEVLAGERRFDLVAMRAVDRMTDAVGIARQLAPELLLLTTSGAVHASGMQVVVSVPVPGSASSVAVRCIS